MDNYIQFPRYSIYLIPNLLFIDQVNDLLLKNNIKFDNQKLSKYDLHYTVKAPFYLSHLYSEENLIKSFQDYFKSNQNVSYKDKFNILGLKKHKNVFALELNTNDKFNFLCNDIMRYFDLFRKTLNQQEIQIDLKRFNNLSSLEMEYYLIWGYPYLFEFNTHHVSIADMSKEIIYNDTIRSLEYSSISLMKQDVVNGNFQSICKIN
ncbi:DUF1045 domain-containing protein [Alphaproteobacteria bacterium]|nr:DUF1045 domain-containing protein [Alphaproteobacteria bacterium]